MPNIEKQLAEHKKNKDNILGTATNMGELSEFHKVVLEAVPLSIDPKDGDIYKHKDGFADKPAEFIISGQGLQRLAVGAGIVWDTTETRVTSRSQQYVAFKALGCIRKTDGMLSCFPAEFDIDMEVEEDNIREQFAEKVKKYTAQAWYKKLDDDSKAAYLETGIRKEINFKKKHKMKLCATGARNRVIRVLLGVKKTYTIAELKKPFVMVRVILVPDYKDPVVKKLMLQASIQSITGIYGAAPAPEETAINIAAEEHEIIPDPEPDVDEGIPQDAEHLNFFDDKKSNLKTFKLLSTKDQFVALKQLAEEKAYNTDGLPVPIIEMDARNRLRFFEHLCKIEKGKGETS